MHPCPHCRTHAVPNFAVRWSSRESPAKCGHCGKLSHVLASTSSGIASLEIVLGALSVVLAMVLASWFAALACFAFLVAHNVWAWRRVELFPISEDSAKTAARVSWWLLALAALFRLFSS